MLLQSVAAVAVEAEQFDMTATFMAVPVVEEQIKVINHRITDLENERK